MFANTFQSGFISIFYSVGSNPLSLWDKQVKNGHIRRVVDDEVKSLVLEVSGTNVATTYVTCPVKPRASLAIRLPFLVMIVKNMKKYFTFEIQILDDKDMHRRFRVSNFQSTTKVRPFCTTMPIGLSSGWNQIQFNLADFTKRAYGTLYIETMRVQVHANVRIRRIYFADRLYNEDEMPSEYKLFLPVAKDKEMRKSKEAVSEPEKAIKTVSKQAVQEEAVEEEPSGAPPTPVTEAVVPDEQRMEEGEYEEDTETHTATTTEVPEGDVSPVELETPDEHVTESEVSKEPESEIQPSEGEGPSEIPTEITTEEPTDISTTVEAPSTTVEAPSTIVEAPSEPQEGVSGITETQSSPEKSPTEEIPSDVPPSAPETDGDEEQEG